MRRRWSEREHGWYEDNKDGKSKWVQSLEGPWAEYWSSSNKKPYYQYVKIHSTSTYKLYKLLIFYRHVLTGETVWNKENKQVDHKYLFEDCPSLSLARVQALDNCLNTLAALNSSTLHVIQIRNRC
jgi:hypothetical protein